MLHRPLLVLLPLAVVVLFVALLSVRPAEASGFCRVQTFHRGGYAVNVATPVAAVAAVAVTPVPVALFQFAAAPTTPPPVTIAPSVLAARQERESELAREVAALRAAVVQLRKERQAATPSATRGEGPPAVPGESDGPPAIAGEPAAVSNAVNREALIVRAGQISSQKCAQCHSARDARGGVVIFDAAGTFAPEPSWKALYASLVKARRRMPLGEPNPLPAQDIEVFKALADSETVR